MDLREEHSGDLHLMPYLMQRLIIIANAANVEPVGAWWRASSRGLAAGYDQTLEAATTGRQAGFRGALCMKAHQVDALNRGFTPSSDETARAGETIDGPRAAMASMVLEWAEACRARDRSKATEGHSTGGA
jgi:citrate lyase beta subunit